MSHSRQTLFNYMNASLKAGRKYQTSDPPRAIDELEKLAVLSDILKLVTQFENKLVNDLDID